MFVDRFLCDHNRIRRDFEVKKSEARLIDRLSTVSHSTNFKSRGYHEVVAIRAICQDMRRISDACDEAMAITELDTLKRLVLITFSARGRHE